MLLLLYLFFANKLLGFHIYDGGISSDPNSCVWEVHDIIVHYRISNILFWFNNAPQNMSGFQFMQKALIP